MQVKSFVTWLDEDKFDAKRAMAALDQQTEAFFKKGGPYIFHSVTDTAFPAQEEISRVVVYSKKK